VQFNYSASGIAARPTLTQQFIEDPFTGVTGKNIPGSSASYETQCDLEPLLDIQQASSQFPDFNVHIHVIWAPTSNQVMRLFVCQLAGN
jgi:hypothetical protein